MSKRFASDGIKEWLKEIRRISEKTLTHYRVGVSRNDFKRWTWSWMVAGQCKSKKDKNDERRLAKNRASKKSSGNHASCRATSSHRIWDVHVIEILGLGWRSKVPGWLVHERLIGLKSWLELKRGAHGSSVTRTRPWESDGEIRVEPGGYWHEWWCERGWAEVDWVCARSWGFRNRLRRRRIMRLSPKVRTHRMTSTQWAGKCSGGGWIACRLENISSRTNKTQR